MSQTEPPVGRAVPAFRPPMSSSQARHCRRPEAPCLTGRGRGTWTKSGVEREPLACYTNQAGESAALWGERIGHPRLRARPGPEGVRGLCVVAEPPHPQQLTARVHRENQSVTVITGRRLRPSPRTQGGVLATAPARRSVHARRGRRRDLRRGSGLLPRRRRFAPGAGRGAR
jgi:hypothetical protein